MINVAIGLLWTDINEIPPVLPIHSSPASTSDVDVLPIWKDSGFRRLSEWSVKLRQAAAV